MANIDEFNRLTLSILDRLAETFPIPSILNVKEFYDDIPDAFAMANFEGTMTFLRREGFIWVEDSAEGLMYTGVQLTMRGLNLLGRTPNSVEKGPTVGERVKTALKVGTKEAFKEVIKIVVSEGARGAI